MATVRRHAAMSICSLLASALLLAMAIALAADAAVASNNGAGEPDPDDPERVGGNPMGCVAQWRSWSAPRLVNYAMEIMECAAECAGEAGGSAADEAEKHAAAAAVMRVACRQRGLAG